MTASTATQTLNEAIDAAVARSLRNTTSTMKEVSRHSESVVAAGFGLCAIGNLLGADASEHYVDEGMTHGLANAVLAIGELLKGTGNRLWDISEESQI